jgi:hypothetical protein
MSFEHRIVIGDWSDDGHNQKAFYTFECSHDEKTVQKAYKEAVKKCKVALHDDDKQGITAICCHYEENSILEEEINALKTLGVDLSFTENQSEEKRYVSSKDIAFIFFEMVKTQIEGFTYKLIPEKKPINGFWKDGFNYGFGYGVFQ